MQELTLTGATILSDYSPTTTGTTSTGNSHGATHGTATTTNRTGTSSGGIDLTTNNNNYEHPYLMLTLGPVVVVPDAAGHGGNHNHPHNHPHQHQHNNGSKKPCCAGPPVVQHRPIVTFKKPASEIVMESSHFELYHLLLQIIRMGSYELFLDLITTWRSSYESSLTNNSTNSNKTSHPRQTNNNNNNVTTFDRMIHAYDTNGHTVTHWAAKRVDDIRIVQYLLYSITYDTTDANEQYVWNTDNKELIPLQIQQHDSSSSGTGNGTIKTNLPTPVHRPTNDTTRMTPLHWACTQENGLSIIKVLLDASNNTTSSSSSSSPTSIATTTTTTTTNATGGTIPSILEIRDGTGCTPCLIASQHGKVETVAYLIQRGANIYAVDTARDSMIHWASYKGSEQVLGLISYYCSDQQFFTPDAYGQTPIHLASLRGNISVVRYILHHLLQQPLQQQAPNSQNNNNNSNQPLSLSVQRLANYTQQHQSSKERMTAIRAVRDLLNLKDQNGRTPYELAVHKNKSAVAAVLKTQMQLLQRQLLPNVWESYMRQYLTMDTIRQLFLLRTWKTWLGLPELDDLDESPRFPFYYVIGQVVCHFFYTFGIFIPLYDISKGVLWDFLILLMINVVLIVVAAYSLYHCHTSNPGRLDASFTNLPYWRRLYEQTLDAFASSDETTAKQAASVQLCHTCHIARPPRSKHDRFSRSCILQFDHHCPFVGTTIGLYNYKWFFMFILSITIYFINFWIMLVVYYTRSLSAHQASTGTLMVGIYLGLHILFSGGMVIYHSQLIFANLTTNEHINLARYDYLWNTTSTSTTTNIDGSIINTGPPRRVFYNPWDKGCLNNMYDRFIQPGDHCYLVPTDREASRTSTIELHQPLVGRMVETV